MSQSYPFADDSSASALNPERALLTGLLKFDKTIVRAKGARLYDQEGRAYLDFSSQYGALPFGYNPDVLWEALQEVGRHEQPSFVQPLKAPAAEALARLLSDVSPGGPRIVVFGNSGAESVEAAIKLARASTGRSTVLATRNGFHGKTLGAASATGTAVYREPFKVDTTRFEHVDYDDAEALRDRLAVGDVAAFIVEPLQGEGGMVVPSPGYLRQAQALCRTHGTLFVVDEVQTGLGRTGKLFACEWDDLDPDVILLAKALGGGLVPLAACLVSERVWHKDMGLYHSSTFANNHLTCSVGLRTLQTMLADGRSFLQGVCRRGERLMTRLQDLQACYPQAFSKVVGKGLMLGLELAPWPAEESYFLGMANERGYRVPLVSGYLLNEHGLVVLPTISRSNVLRIQPSLLISDEEIDEAVGALAAAGKLIQSARFAELIHYGSGAQAVQDHAAPARMPPRVVAEPGQPYLGRFAFLMHPTDFDDMIRCMPVGCEQYPPAQKEALRQWMARWRDFDSEPSAVYQLPRLASRDGGYVDGCLISSMLTPREMMRLRPAEKRALIDSYVDVARREGAHMIGLGAFTSVISRAGQDIGDVGIPITTGNSLTAMMCVEGLRQAARRLGRPLHLQTVAVIGAAGSVGRLAALDVAPHCRRLVLFGNPSNPTAVQDVQAVAGEIYQRLLALPAADVPGGVALDIAALRKHLDAPPDEILTDRSEASCRRLFELVESLFAQRIRRAPPILVSVDLQSRLRLAEAIISATSNGRPFVKSSWIADDAIVCDAARPGDVAEVVMNSRPELFLFEGGLVRLPERISLGRNNVLGFQPGINLACLSETIALTMSQVRSNTSLGRRIPLEEAHAVAAMARRHGFECHLPEPDVEAAEADARLIHH